MYYTKPTIEADGCNVAAPLPPRTLGRAISLTRLLEAWKGSNLVTQCQIFNSINIVGRE